MVAFIINYCPTKFPYIILLKKKNKKHPANAAMA